MTPTEKKRLQSELNELIMTVLRRHTGLSYFQVSLMPLLEVNREAGRLAGTTGLPRHHLGVVSLVLSLHPTLPTTEIFVCSWIYIDLTVPVPVSVSFTISQSHAGQFAIQRFQTYQPKRLIHASEAGRSHDRQRRDPHETFIAGKGAAFDSGGGCARAECPRGETRGIGGSSQGQKSRQARVGEARRLLRGLELAKNQGWNGQQSWSGRGLPQVGQIASTSIRVVLVLIEIFADY